MTKHFDIVGKTDETRIIGGDDKQLLLTVPNVAAGIRLVRAWFTVKVSDDDPDPGLIQKVMTSIDNPGVGQIVDDGAISHVGSIRVDLGRNETPLLIVPYPFYGLTTYNYDVQVGTEGGQIETSIEGAICAFKGVTADSAF